MPFAVTFTSFFPFLYVFPMFLLDHTHALCLVQFFYEKWFALYNNFPRLNKMHGSFLEGVIFFWKVLREKKFFEQTTSSDVFVPSQYRFVGIQSNPPTIMLLYLFVAEKKIWFLHSKSFTNIIWNKHEQTFFHTLNKMYSICISKYVSSSSTKL